MTKPTKSQLDTLHKANQAGKITPPLATDSTGKPIVIGGFVLRNIK